MDGGIGGENSGLQARLRPDVSRSGRPQVGEEGAGSETAGHLASGGTAHSIADNEGADLGRDGTGVFVMAAAATDIGQHGVDEMVCGHGH